MFVRDLQNNIKDTGATPTAGKIQYLHTLIYEEALRDFETLLEQIGYIANTNLTQFCFGTRYVFLSY